MKCTWDFNYEICFIDVIIVRLCIICCVRVRCCRWFVFMFEFYFIIKEFVGINYLFLGIFGIFISSTTIFSFIRFDLKEYIKKNFFVWLSLLIR